MVWNDGFVLLPLCVVLCEFGGCFAGVLSVGTATRILLIGTPCCSVGFLCISCIGLSWLGSVVNVLGLMVFHIVCTGLWWCCCVVVGSSEWVGGVVVFCCMFGFSDCVRYRIFGCRWSRKVGSVVCWSLTIVERSGLSANCSTCWGFQVSIMSSRCMSILDVNAIKISLIRSSSAVTRRHFAPRAFSRQWKLSSFSLSFCLQVNKRKRLYVMFLGRVKEMDSSWASSNAVMWSITECGKRWLYIRWPSDPRLRYMRLLTFRFASSQGIQSILGPLNTVVLHSFSRSTFPLLFLRSLSRCWARVSFSVEVPMWVRLGIWRLLPPVFVWEGSLRVPCGPFYWGLQATIPEEGDARRGAQNGYCCWLRLVVSTKHRVWLELCWVSRGSEKTSAIRINSSI